jgi:tetratricopeptide (TPR) repeat protein
MRQNKAKTPDAGAEIESAIERDDWPGARKLIEEELAKDPDDHWLLTRLSLTYYEQFDYQKALDLSERALSIAPECPLAMWDRAGALEMLNRTEQAIAAYQQIIKRGIESLSSDECGEGLPRGRGFHADSHYRMANCQRNLGKTEKAIELLKRHLELRGPGCQSIYAIAAVRKELKQLEGRA